MRASVDEIARLRHPVCLGVQGWIETDWHGCLWFGQMKMFRNERRDNSEAHRRLGVHGRLLFCCRLGDVFQSELADYGDVVLCDRLTAFCSQAQFTSGARDQVISTG